MSNEIDVQNVLKEFASKGVTQAMNNKAIKNLKADGTIKPGKKGKAPVDDPARNSIRDYLLKGNVLKIVTDNVGEAKSLMVTLNNDWNVNFVKKVTRIPKKKKDNPEGKEDNKPSPEPSLA